jgi:ADP-ribose pyrophosphatase YjhB (NUDIX family)
MGQGGTMSEPFSDTQIVTVDVVLLTVVERGLAVALLRRENPPFAGELGLIGGYVHADKDKSTDDTAARVLRDKTGLTGLFVEQLATFSGPSRDPRGWSVSVAYYALVPHTALEAALGEAPRLKLVPVAEAKSLPFDHDAILAAAVERLRGKGAYSTLPAQLIEQPFTLSELQQVYEIALATPRIDKSSFRRKLNELDLIEPAEGRRNDTGGRQAQLYRLRPGALVFNRRI